MNRLLGACVVYIAAAAPYAAATDRYYPDSFAVSPNGRYRIDAKSPDNAGEHPRPFASDFTYTLTDTSTGKVLWQRRQPMTRSKGSERAWPAEASPVAVFVNDEGLVAARLAHDTLIFLERADGGKRAEAAVLDAFPQDEQDKFVAHTTAGPMWSQDSDWFFLTVPAESGRATTYFVVRPYWHHRIIADTRTGKHVDLGAFHSAAGAADMAQAPDAVRALMTAVMAEEQRRALAALAVAPASLSTGEDRGAYRATSSALHTVAFLRMTEAEPQLRTLEGRLDSMPQWGDYLRGKVRETIRALGKVPTPGYGVRLYPLVNRDLWMQADTDNPYRAAVPAEERTANASKVAAGMSVVEFTELLGCPDARLFDEGHCFDYDIDDEPPYTLRVHFDQGQQSVVRLKKIAPFAFLHDPARMQGY